MRSSLLLILVLGLSLIGAAPVLSDLELAIEWMEKYPLIDGHNDLPYQLFARHGNAIADVDLTQNQPRLQTDIPRLREGRMGAQFWSVYISCNKDFTSWSDDVRRTMEQIDVTLRMIDDYPEHFELALTAQSIRDIFARGRIASLMGMEGGHSIDSSLAALRLMHDLGVRYMTLTHSCHTPWADTCSEAPIHQGLTEFGKKLVLEMNRIGMFVDISHVSEAVMRQVLEISKAPIIFSHSSAFALCNNTRNVPDEVLQLVVKNRGVVMVNFYSGYICCSLVCDLVNVADHIEYLARRVGVDYVGIGGDYDGVSALPSGLEDVSKYPYLFAELIRRGFVEEEVAKILGGNLLRAMEEMEIAAQTLQSQGPDESRITVTKTCSTEAN